MPHTDFTALNTALSRIANQNDPTRPSQAGIFGGPFTAGGVQTPPTLDVSDRAVSGLSRMFQQAQAVRDAQNPELAAAQRQAGVQRFQQRRDPIPPQTMVTPDGASPFLTNQGGPMTELRQQADIFRDPNFQDAAAGQRQQSITGAINTSPQVLSSLLANERAQMNNQSRADLQTQRLQASQELAQLNQAAATGRTALSQEQQNRRAQLSAFLQLFDAQAGLSQDFPTTFGFGGPPEDLQQSFSGLQEQVGSFGAPINTGPPAAAPQQQGQFQVGQVVPAPDGRQFRVVGFDTDGEPLVEPLQ